MKTRLAILMFSNDTNNYFHLDRHFYSLEFRLFTTFLNKTGRLKKFQTASPIQSHGKDNHPYYCNHLIKNDCLINVCHISTQ
ncbi:hypothetical protein ACTHUD_23205, partial [Neisseria sp. P0016.S002]